MTESVERRIHNPFHDPLVTELIEDPIRYHQMFSESILVGEALKVFQPANVALVGPQGSGKSMILNLVRYSVISKWIADTGAPPEPLAQLTPFFGISVNLVRANFHAFGRRSVSRVRTGELDKELEATVAADFLTHYLFREYLKGLGFLLSTDGRHLMKWLKFDRGKLQREIQKMNRWDSWFGFYSECRSLASLIKRCEYRLSIWRSFLNANIDQIPEEVWKSKALLEDSLHSMGNVLRDSGPAKQPVSLFVVIDQYEVLPELNRIHGDNLQRIINTLIKTRDPVAFYKIGARTYDWGRELRIWGSESRVEVQRDYATINLADLLMRNEDGDWLFLNFAKDVAYKRMKEQQYQEAAVEHIDEIFGSTDPETEARLYFGKRAPIAIVKRVPPRIKRRIESLCGVNPSPLDLRLAEAWALQKLQKGIREKIIISELKHRPWNNWSWRKERIPIALLQIASLTNQKRRYFGWKTILFLSGANISSFLLLCSEIWDLATKLDINPLEDYPLRASVQADGIHEASNQWRNRDRNEHTGGRKRWEVLSRLGPAIHEALVEDLAISNPGHSGFSVRESEFSGSERGERLARFLQDAVSWAIFEERAHTSKQRESSTRRKWYLHPLLSPAFSIPHIRSKEPLYVHAEQVYEWIFEGKQIKFRPLRSRRLKEHENQLTLRIEDKEHEASVG